MPFFTRLLLALSVLLFVAPDSEAEGLMQVTFGGSVETRGGGTVEIQWGFFDGEAVKDAHLRLHLAQRTSSFDLASLLVARLRAEGAKVQFPAEKGASKGPVHVFVAASTQLKLRLGDGLWATVTLCESGPEKVRLTKPSGEHLGGLLLIRTSTFLAHTKEVGSVLLELQIEDQAHPTSICGGLFDQALKKGLISDRPTADSWRPSKTDKGASLTGCSIGITKTKADWGLEVFLSPPAAAVR
ncbi:MAG: hypothetical protein ACI8X5_002119 [Planctomycetota bacterium]|jgi:hypothetical protein